MSLRLGTKRGCLCRSDNTILQVGGKWMLHNPRGYHPVGANGCSFHGLWSEDPNQYLTEFLNLWTHLTLTLQIKKGHASLELGKNGSAFIQGEMLKRMKDPRLFTLPYRLGNSKAFDTLADLGSCVNLIPLYLFKKLKIGLLEETDHVFGLADGTKSYLVGIVKNVEVHIGRLKLLEDFYVIDMEKDLATPLLVVRGFLATASAVINLFRKMLEFLRAILINPKGNMWDSGVLVDKRVDWNKPPNREDGAWHIRIELNAFILA
ncbi:MAK10-like protein [Tanacetum coccineum]